MQSEIVALQREVAALKQQVQGKRKRFKERIAAGLIAGFVAVVPMSLYAANPVFSDLGEAAPVHQSNIQAIGNAGITTGFADPANPGQRTYNPKGFVTREEMASFLARTAGLGGNSPIVNAQTAVNAQSATNAANATNAITATNAQALQGFAPSGLVRTSGGSQGNNPATVGTSYQALTSVTIAAPGPGFVYLTGSVTAYATSSSNAYVSAAIVDTAAGIGSFPQSAVVGTQSGTAFASTISPTVVLPVTSARTITYSLLVAKDPASIGSTAATTGSVSALFVPFGSGGAIGAEVPQNFMPIGDPPTRP